MQNVFVRRRGLTRPRPMNSSWAERHRVAQRPEMLLDQRRGNRSWPAGTGVCVVKTTCERHAADRLVDVDALGLHAPPDQLEHRERAVPLVQMHDAGRDAQRGERAHAADAEQQFLADADAVVAAVEPRRQLAIFGLIAVDVRVEQQQRAAPDGQLSRRARRSCRCASRSSIDDRHAVGRPPARSAAGGCRRRCSPRAASRRVEPLAEVALVVVQADADERNAEIRCALDVVAGENAEAARVDRQRFVQPELGREIGDRPRPQHAGMARAPGVRRAADTPACGGRRS